MIVKLVGVKGYNYKDKQGMQKNGLMLEVMSADQLSEDDENGNYTYGYIVDQIFVPRSLSLSPEFLVESLGKKIDLVYDRGLGQKYERLTAVNLVD